MSIDIEATNPEKINLTSKINTAIYGLDLSGNIVLSNTESFAKIILIDEFGKEYLIQEFFYPLYRPGQYKIKGCEEIDLIKGIIPSKIKIVSKNTNILIEKLKYCLNANDSLSKYSISTDSQIQSKIIMLNQNLIDEGFLWRAESNEYNKYYSYRNIEYPDTINTYGFEYYSFGIFSPVSESEVSKYKNKAKSSNYVDEFDWRYRHGAMNPGSPYYDSEGMDYANGSYIPNGWMTKIHCQYGNNGAPWERCGNGCFLFGPINATEARMNLYYNQHLNYDLSEQDAMDCNPYNPGNCYVKGYTSLVLKYIKNFGVVDENCFPYINDTTQCSEKCTNPAHKIKIENYFNIYSPTEEEIEIKHIIIHHIFVLIKQNLCSNLRTCC
ncbi:MAG: hypothetical protein GXO83_06225 [Chlorobi bacterium]|nr:hypothetical protein [Chlorobiota bacterium]